MADFPQGYGLGPGQPVDGGYGQTQVIRVQRGGDQGVFGWKDGAEEEVGK